MSITLTSTNRDLLDDVTWQKLIGRIMRDEQVDRPQAESIMDEALGFLKRCADEPHEVHTPSRRADIGWHTFLMYTREYHNWCFEVAGRFLHHAPLDEPTAAAECNDIGPSSCSCDPGQCCNFPS